MLTLSRSAGEAIKDYVHGSPEVLDELGGIRLYLAETSSGEQQLALALSHTPEVGDEIIEQDGARVFIEESVRDYVADKQLDISDETEDGQAGFQLTEPDR